MSYENIPDIIVEAFKGLTDWFRSASKFAQAAKILTADMDILIPRRSNFVDQEQY